MSIQGATKAGVYVFAKNINEEIIKIDQYPILTYNNPFSTIKQIGIKRKITSLMRLLYLECIAFFGNRNDIFFFPAPEVPFSVIFFKKRFIVTIHDLYAWKNLKETTFFASIKNKLLPIIANKAELICTVSEYSKSEIIKYLNISTDKIFVVHNGLDEVFLDKPKINIEVLKNKRYILNVGSLEPRKNISFLIDLFETIKNQKNYSDLLLVLTGGESWNSNEILNKINNSVYKNDFILLGQVSQNQLPNLYKDAVAMIFPSKEEGFGIPVIESLSQGTPVLVQANSALKDFKEYGAYVMEDFNIDTWLTLITEIEKNKVRISKNNINKVIYDFSWKNSANKLLNELLK